MALSDRPVGPQTIAASSSAQSGLNVQAVLNAVMPALQVLASSTETVIVNPENTAIALILALPPYQPSLEQTAFDLWASGYTTTTASGTITIKLYSGTSTTVGSDTALGSSGAVTQNTASAPWRVHAELLYDSVSGKLTGTIEFSVNNSLVTKVALTNVVTGISNLTNPVASFVISFTSSGATSGTPTTVNVQKFSVG
jgi:hypothetical protein